MDRTLFGSVMNTVPHAIFWKDKHLVFQGCNKQFAQQFGYLTPADIVGKTDYDFPFPEHLIALYQADDRNIIETGKPKLNYEEVQVQADGSEKIVLLSKVPYLDEHHQIVGILGIYTDITERKKNEVLLKQAKELAEAASRAKTEFLENMRHDIRTPLSGIVGFSEVLKNEARDPKIKDYADSLVASSHALLNFLDEVLEAIRVSAGEMLILKKKFNFRNTLQDIMALNQAKARQKKLAFSLSVDEAIPRFVLGDKTRIHRIVLELVGNALNFTDKGGIKIEAVLAKREKNRLVIKIMVEDSGIGIAKECQQDIYLQFKRLTPSYAGTYQGIGLGLAVIKQFVDDLRGEIYVESKPACGTRFTCVLPLHEALLDDADGIDDEPPLVMPTCEQSVRPILAAFPDVPPALLGHSILLVEDNQVAQEVAKAILSSFHCQVDCASNAETALRLWQQGSYDLILLDIGLPDRDGFDLAQEIRVLEASTASHTPIVALTAHVGEENRQRCYASGMTAVISKPLMPQRCHDILSAYLPHFATHSDKCKIESHRASSAHVEMALETWPLLDIADGVKNTHSEAMLAKILDLLVSQSLPEDMDALRQAHAAQHWSQIQKLAHKIKGGAVYAGTKRMHKACDFLEQVIQNDDTQACEEMYQQTLEVMHETAEQASRWLATVNEALRDGRRASSSA